MNRGTALKWADKLEVCQDLYDNSQFSFEVDGQTHSSPLGVLADFLDPSGWATSWGQVSRLWHGEQFKLPDVWLKKAKIKSNSFELYELFDRNITGGPLAFEMAATYVRDNYETI